MVAAIPNIRHIVLPLYATPEQTLTFGEMCPCGSGKPESQCCGLYLAGAPAPTAVALMRSRYTAYVRGAIDYLVATHDASTRDTVDVKAVTKWSRQTLWLGLEIVDHPARRPEGRRGRGRVHRPRLDARQAVRAARAVAVPARRGALVLHRRRRPLGGLTSRYRRLLARLGVSSRQGGPMRTVVFAFVTLVAGCGDNIRPGLVRRHAGREQPRSPPAIRSARNARSSTSTASPALDPERQPADRRDRSRRRLRGARNRSRPMRAGRWSRRRPGPRRCGAPRRASRSSTRRPSEVTIVAGPPVRVITHLDHADDARRRGRRRHVPRVRRVRQPGHQLSCSRSRCRRSGAGTIATATDVTATIAGEYSRHVRRDGRGRRRAGRPRSSCPRCRPRSTGVLDPERTLYAILDQVTLIAAAFDEFGNRVDDVTLCVLVVADRAVARPRAVPVRAGRSVST